MTSRFPPFAFVELVSPYNKKNITRWLEDMNFMFSWQEQYLTHSLRSLVRYCSCHSNIKFISSRHRVISSIYYNPVCRGSICGILKEVMSKRIFSQLTWFTLTIKMENLRAEKASSYFYQIFHRQLRCSVRQ